MKIDKRKTNDVRVTMFEYIKIFWQIHRNISLVACFLALINIENN